MEILIMVVIAVLVKKVVNSGKRLQSAIKFNSRAVNRCYKVKARIKVLNNKLAVEIKDLINETQGELAVSEIKVKEYKEYADALRVVVNCLLDAIDRILDEELWKYSIEERIEILDLFNMILTGMFEVYSNQFKDKRQEFLDLLKQYNVI